MALVKRESQLSVSALAKQTAKESDRKRNVKVLDEETYVQVRIHRVKPGQDYKDI